ncbi:MAG TPA: hypothetical protein PKE26_13940 [Kiritimatiellia bacterium]|nr:hypothetical protein [Kiritimatiellia bacterium]HMP00204.1 hypothetical protein [Kiritimatiellia bacterium]HMP96733.1 hypothetical protein [Kiritimatiellia bacterium]
MKTTIDLPDELLHRAKVVAAKRNTTLKSLIIKGLNGELSSDSARREVPDQLLVSLSIGRNQVPVGRLNRDELYDRPMLR